jgi:hypothetical protein
VKEIFVTGTFAVVEIIIGSEDLKVDPVKLTLFKKH